MIEPDTMSVNLNIQGDQTMFKKTAFNLSLVASLILIFAGVPGVENIGPAGTGFDNLAHADLIDEGFHGVWLKDDGSCSSVQKLEDVIDHMLGHCNWWQISALVLAFIAAIAVLGAVLISLIPTANAAASISAAIISGLKIGAIGIGVVVAAMAIVATVCFTTWKGWEDYCLDD